MEWTKEKPIEAGWYWYRDTATRPECVEITREGGQLMVWRVGYGGPMPIDSMYGLWQGPIHPA